MQKKSVFSIFFVFVFTFEIIMSQIISHPLVTQLGPLAILAKLFLAPVKRVVLGLCPFMQWPVCGLMLDVALS